MTKKLREWLEDFFSTLVIWLFKKASEEDALRPSAGSSSDDDEQTLWIPRPPPDVGDVLVVSPDVKEIVVVTVNVQRGYAVVMQVGSDTPYDIDLDLLELLLVQKHAAKEPVEKTA